MLAPARLPRTLMPPSTTKTSSGPLALGTATPPVPTLAWRVPPWPFVPLAETAVLVEPESTCAADVEVRATGASLPSMTNPSDCAGFESTATAFAVLLGAAAALSPTGCADGFGDGPAEAVEALVAVVAVAVGAGAGLVTWAGLGTGELTAT